jgi:hypothetical protein
MAKLCALEIIPFIFCWVKTSQPELKDDNRAQREKWIKDDFLNGFDTKIQVCLF